MRHEDRGGHNEGLGRSKTATKAARLSRAQRGHTDLPWDLETHQRGTSGRKRAPAGATGTYAANRAQPPG